MNFLLRSTTSVSRDVPSAPEMLRRDSLPMHRRASTLEGLIAEDPFSRSSSENGDSGSEETGDKSGEPVDTNSDNQVPMGNHSDVAMSNHSDVAEGEGWITIPCKELTEGWKDASDILQLRSLDRSFVFPGEQIHLLVCLSASKQDTGIMTPFKVPAVISKNGENGETMSTAHTDHKDEDISTTESLRVEDHKQQTDKLLEGFRNSSFFVRIAQSDEPLWSKRNVVRLSSSDSQKAGCNNINLRKTSQDDFLTAVIDRGGLNGNASGGVDRNAVRCYSLCSGDIVVLLEVNVASCNIRNPILEVLQFEKYEDPNAALENVHGLHPNHEDPYGELRNWLLPLDRTLPPPRSLLPPLSPSSGLGGATQRSVSATTNATAGAQIFSFSHLRSYSMPSLPQVSGPPYPATKPSFDLEDYDHFAQEKMTSRDIGNKGMLSFRGVPLEPQRFSVHCGLEGIYVPGRRWCRKIEIIQPIEIHCFAAECVTEDLLCIQVKNVAPAHLPDIIIFLDAIAIVIEEASKDGLPVSLPIVSIETGNGHTLPNLPLRRGEEHSFVLKPAITEGMSLKGQEDKTLTSNVHLTRDGDRRAGSQSCNQYAILVSCHCNYTESKLSFKKPTTWRPRVAKDLMICLASEISEQTSGPNGRNSQLPVKVLSLQASNFTSEDLTLTILAPVESSPPPSVVPLNSDPSSPNTPIVVFPELMKRAGGVRFSSSPLEPENHEDSNDNGKRSNSPGQRTDATSDGMSSSDSGITHLWLQSAVPLGCVPAGSSATVKLELLPLTDGIITLNTLEVAVKEKGRTYRPEQSLKIYATSSMSTRIV